MNDVMQTLTGVGAWIELSSAGSEHSRYGFGRGYLDRGKELILEKLEKLYAWGVRVAYLHRPDGEYPDGGPMNFNSRVQIMRDRSSTQQERMIVDRRKTDDFLAEAERRFPGMVLVVYLGALHHAGLAAKLGGGNVSGWMGDIVDSAAPYLNSKICCLGIDASSAYLTSGGEGLDSSEWQVVELLDSVLRRLGRCAFLEAFADPSKPEQFSMAQLAAEWIWRGRVRGLWFPAADHWRSINSRHIARVWSGHSINPVGRPNTRNDFDNDVMKWLADCLETGTLPVIAEGEIYHNLMERFRTLGAAVNTARKSLSIEGGLSVGPATTTLTPNPEDNQKF